MNLNSLFHRTRPVISLLYVSMHRGFVLPFVSQLTVLSHSTKSQASVAALKYLKEVELKREEARKPITLEVTEEAPTSTQMQNIIDIIGERGIGDLVPGAFGKADAIKIADKNPSQVARPIVVDWGNAHVVLGGDAQKIRQLIEKMD